ncbi:DUF3802 family protein [Thalassomonas viridans]|uniref:DUF3802 family protein n=1 Tax=Thalassomonas viridans TaxID=137584 RepID=A0AAF0C9G6_9GAMM|nr:DUF3802 family protein [Thalassomonas viridans]WDE05743.1 DUF3802 family protein [Thalassomonas viridans]
MVTNTQGYMHVIEYLTEHLSIFETPEEELAANPTPAKASHSSIMSMIEEELSEQIIMVCSQNTELSFNQRNMIIREVDEIVYDLEEILSGIINNQVTEEQLNFIVEFAGLIKNLFDTEIHSPEFQSIE